jgi:hypothetical protein
VRQATSVAAQITLSVDEVPTDPDSNAVTVSATRLNGASLFTGLTATRLSAGVYQMALTPTHTALLDTLKLTWTYARSGAVMSDASFIEICGGFLVPLAALRKRLPDVATYTTVDLLNARTDAEQAIEDEVGTAFVPRYAYEQIEFGTRTFVGVSAGRVRLNKQRPRVVREVTFGGISYNQAQLNQLLINVSGSTVDLYAGPFGTVGYIGYEYGYDFPPKPVVDAILDAAVFYAGQVGGQTNAGIDPRATRIVTQDGTVELGGGGVTGIASVDSVIKRYRRAMIA